MKHNRIIFSIPLLLASLLVLCSPAFAQNTKVKGRVTDAETGEPIPFANVFFEGTTIGVSTDMDGNYHIYKKSDRHPTQVLLHRISGEGIYYKVKCLQSG